MIRYSSYSRLVGLACIGLTASTYSLATQVESNGVTTSQMVQGGVGLIQTPTSRMNLPGELSVNYTDNNEYRFWTVSLQLFPWMEATARYTDVRTQLYSADPGFSGDQTLKDKGLDVKFRLWQESFYLPQVSLGFRDFGGTGFFESEYIAASKAIGPFDFHIGAGWGYMGTADDLTNPFCELADRFCERPSDFSGRGGRIDYQQFFRGPMSVFGGIEYQTPWKPLRFMLEYEGNDYSQDRAGDLLQDSRWNLGAAYNIGNWDFSLNYQRGNTLGFGLSYRFNMHKFQQIKYKPAKRELIGIKQPNSVDTINYQRLYDDLATNAGFVISDAKIDDETAVIYGNQVAYSDQTESIERTARVIAAELPKSVKTYNVIENAGHVPMVNSVIDAEAFIEYATYQSLDASLDTTYVRETPNSTLSNDYAPNRTSGAFYSADFFWSQTFGSPEDFYLYQGGIVATAGYAINENWSLVGSLRATLLDNFDKFTFTVDNQETALPRVRTQVREYVTGSNLDLDTAFLHWTEKLSDNWFGQAYAGYLETMFGGIGAEFMYRPIDSNLFFGVDVNYVKQRDFDSNTKFFDYSAVTGHATAYWRPEFLPDTQISVGVGQFLAKDRGVNIDFAKRFDSGIIVGAYAAITDVSSEEYGEGSFTKGFYISVPIDLFVLRPAKGRGMFPWVPISRDGGQMLRRPSKLSEITDSRSPFIQ